MELKVNFKDNNFVIEDKLSNEKLNSFLKEYCEIFLKYKDFFDLETFELSLSTEKNRKRVSKAKKYYFVKYNKKKEDLEYCYPIKKLQSIMSDIIPVCFENFTVFFDYKSDIDKILGDLKKESFFLKVRLNKNTQNIAYKTNVQLKDLDINKENFQHLITYANSLAIEYLVIDIIKKYMEEENISFEEAMSFFEENRNYEKYKNKIILSNF